MTLTLLRLALVAVLVCIPVADLQFHQSSFVPVTFLTVLALMVCRLGAHYVDVRNARQLGEIDEWKQHVKHAALGSAAWVQDQLQRRLTMIGKRDS